MNKREVIIVTDGDMAAKSAVEMASSNIGGRCISFSAGNPTQMTGIEIIEFIKVAKYDPVVVMVDDRGLEGVGKGEHVLKELINSEELKILGVVAVASNGKDKNGLEVNFSITKDGKKVESAVDKYGNMLDLKTISGDTISILKSEKHKIPVIVGIGDPGKMDNMDSLFLGAPITTLALKEVINFTQN